MGFPPINGGGGGAPTTAHYILDTADGALPNARVITSGTRIDVDESVAGIARIAWRGMAAGVVHRSANQTIPDTTLTRVAFDVVDYDPEGLWDAPNSEFVVPAGNNLYQLTANIKWSYVGGTHLLGLRETLFQVLTGAGSIVGESRIAGSVVGADGYFTSDIAYLVTGSGTPCHVRCSVQQTSGAALDIFDLSSFTISQFE